MKTNESNKENETIATPAIFTSADVKAAIAANVKALEMTRGVKASCSSEQYGAILFMTAADLGIVPKTAVTLLMQMWDAFPKSPSAFRQVLEKEETGAQSPQASAILDKLLNKAQS